MTNPNPNASYDAGYDSFQSNAGSGSGPANGGPSATHAPSPFGPLPVHIPSLFGPMPTLQGHGGPFGLGMPMQGGPFMPMQGSPFMPMQAGPFMPMQAGSFGGIPPFPSNPAASGRPAGHSQNSSQHQVRYVPAPVPPQPGLVGPGVPGAGDTFEPPQDLSDQEPPPVPTEHEEHDGDDFQWGSPTHDFIQMNQVSFDGPLLSSALCDFYSHNPDIMETPDVRTFAQDGQSDNKPSRRSHTAKAALAGIPYPQLPESGGPDVATSSQAGPSSYSQPGPSSSSQAGPSSSSQAGASSSSRAAPSSSTLPDPPLQGPKTIITITDIIGGEAVQSAFSALNETTKNLRLPSATRRQNTINLLVQITKEWTIALIASRLFGGQLPDQTELVDICGHALGTPEIGVLYSTSCLHSGFPLGYNQKWQQELPKGVVKVFEAFVTAPAMAAVTRWHHDLLGGALFYTLAHLIPSSRMFPDFSDSWPVDNALKMKTLLLAKTGAYMHLYCKQKKSQSTTLFHMLLDSRQHPTGAKAYDMALDIQQSESGSRYACRLFQHSAVGSLTSFVSHILVYSNCAVLAAFLTGQNKLVNHQLTRAGQAPGQTHLLIPFCCGILSLALAGIEEFGHRVSVEAILQNEGLMHLLYLKVGYTRDFINFMSVHGTESEKKDMEWLNKSTKSRIAIAITPFHQDVVADLSFVVQPSRSAKFSKEFANLESESDFRKTYSAYQNSQDDSPFSENMKGHVVLAQQLDLKRLELRQQSVALQPGPTAFLLAIGTRTLEHVGLQTLPQPGATAPASSPPAQGLPALDGLQLPSSHIQQPTTSQLPALPASVGSPMQEDGVLAGESSSDSDD